MIEVGKSWTVQQLIDALQKIEDKSRTVWTEGCDCWGDVAGVEDFNGTLLIVRAEAWR